MVTANVNKRTTESKYVTCFADARPDVDITFRDVLLSRPTDHYLVGVDNFSLTSTGLSMIEPLQGDYTNLLRIVRNRTAVANVPNPVDPDALDAVLVTDGLDVGPDLDVQADVPGYDFSIKTTEVILSIQQLLHRLSSLAADVNEFMQTNKAAPASNFNGEFGYVSAADEKTEHLKFQVRSDGKLEIIGTRAFWGCFSFEVPSPQYQFGFWGCRKPTDDNPFRMRRFLSVNPETGVSTFSKILVNSTKKVAAPGAQLTAVEHAYNDRTIYGRHPQFVTAASVLQNNQNLFNTHGGAKHAELVTFQTTASLFSTLERRVALELSCSLPIKNSPMIDHQKETPDFVLARWIWRTDGHVDSNAQGGSSRYASVMPACIEYQGARDRITYHELQAQAKIQTLRIKLFARVRFFDETAEKWSMRVVELPTNNTDWWHSRLHFVSKD